MAKSEFGKGFVYNLILFAAHYERIGGLLESYKKAGIEEDGAYELWFNAAGDHFFEFEIPKQWEKKAIGRLARNIKKRAIGYRIHFVWDKKGLGEKEFNKVWEDTKRLARMIDKELGVKVVKGTWE